MRFVANGDLYCKKNGRPKEPLCAQPISTAPAGTEMVRPPPFPSGLFRPLAPNPPQLVTDVDARQTSFTVESGTNGLRPAYYETMSQLESYPTLSWDRNANRGKGLVVVSFLISGILAAGALIVTAGDGAQAARELVMRFSSLLFVFSLLAAPLARIVPARSLSSLALMSGNLRLAFVAAFVFSLACILMPAAVAGEALSAPTVLYIALNGVVLLVMLFPANRTAALHMGTASWRAIQLMATAYFWLSFLVSALIHIARQNDSLGWHAMMLALLIIALGTIIAARFCDESPSRRE